MLKIIYIKSCKECPFASMWFNRENILFCHKMSLQADSDTFPDWCPLEAASEPSVEDGRVNGDLGFCEGDVNNKCPKCKGLNLEEKLERSVSSNVGWEDGLGSPGTIRHKCTTWLCKDCLHVWESIALDKNTYQPLK